MIDLFKSIIVRIRALDPPDPKYRIVSVEGKGFLPEFNCPTRGWRMLDKHAIESNCHSRAQSPTYRDHWHETEAAAGKVINNHSTDSGAKIK